jgi:SM-20-related protein
MLFDTIAQDLVTQGFSVQPNALPPELAQSLQQQAQATDFCKAGIGRNSDHALNDTIRSDEICWITEATEAGAHWLNWAEALKTYLNQRLFLGLFSFESHFAHYAPGDFYKKHVDAFRGETNRVLSLVVYLNEDWQAEHGGELVIYNEHGDELHRVSPELGTIVVFLSEEFPHEVLPAQRDRYSIAGWFRVNTSNAGRVDPPR